MLVAESKVENVWVKGSLKLQQLANGPLWSLADKLEAGQFFPCFELVFVNVYNTRWY